MKLSCLKHALVAMACVALVTVAPKAEVMLTNLDQPNGIGGTPISLNLWFGTQFITDNSAPGFVLESVTVTMDLAAVATGDFFLSIFSNDAGTPGILLETLVGNANPAAAGNHTYTSSGLNLNANTSYWAVLGVSAGTGSYAWAMPDNDLYTGPWTIPTISTHSYSFDQGAGWSVGDGFARKLAVSAVAVPEPSAGILVGLGAAVLLLRPRKRA